MFKNNPKTVNKQTQPTKYKNNAESAKIAQIAQTNEK